MRNAMRLAQIRAISESGMAKQVRQGSRLSLSDVAQDVGVSITTVYRWEEGQRRPTGAAALRYHDLITRLVRK